jgi:PAS domain S-box-containing protein
MPFDPSATAYPACGNCSAKGEMLKIVLIYVLVGSLWVFASDRLLIEYFDDSGSVVAAGTAKGLLFVAITAGLLLFFLNKLAGRLTERAHALQLVTDQAGDALVVFDAQLQVIYANPAACQMSGYSVEELRGSPASALLPERAGSLLPAHLERLSRQPFSRDEWPLLCKDGREKIIDITTQRLPDGRYLAIGRDLSESREAQRQIASERCRLKTLVNAIPDAIWMKDTEGRYLAVNPGLEALLGRSEAEIIGHDDQQLFPPEFANRSITSDHQVLERRQVQLFVEHYRHPDGGLRQFETIKAPVFDALGQLTGVLGIARDMTLAQAAREALKESEKRFRTLFENASDAAFVIDSNMHFANINQRACDSLGYSRQELLGMTVADIDADEDSEELRDMALNPRADNAAITVYRQHRRADGSVFPVELRISRLLIDDQPCFLALARDITEREETLQALRASAEFSRAVLDSTSSQVAVLDQDGRIVAVNESWRRFARERTLSPVQLASTGVGINFLEVCRSTQGEQRDSAMRACHGVLDVLQGDADNFSFDCPCQSRDEQMWFIMNVTPLRSGIGGAVITYLDITEIKHAQQMRERAVSQLKALASKHLSIQEEERRLLSMEIHDQIGQMLTGLKLTLGTLLRKSTEQLLCHSPMEHAIEIVDGLLDTTRDIARRLRPPMLDDLGLIPAVRWHVSKLTIPDGATISLDENIGQQRLPPAIELACFRLVQEAVSNALRHAGASTIIISIQRQSEQLKLSISDDGIGFDIEETFRKSEKLTSLGLLGMRERVADLAGDFQLQSTQRCGTNLTASFSLPNSG